MNIKAVIFDLGGVLIELQGPPPLPGLPESEVWNTWLLSTSVRLFESGACDGPTFAASLIEEFGLEADPHEFIKNFEAWPGSFFPGAVELLDELRKVTLLASLSNTNVTHWERFERDTGLPKLFHHNFPSHQTGLVKPDVNAFEHVIETLALDASEVLFLDDNELNIAAAQNLGLNACLTLGIEAAREHLRAFKVL